MMIQMTRGELGTISRVLKELLSEGILIEDVKEDINECIGIVDSALLYAPTTALPEA